MERAPARRVPQYSWADTAVAQRIHDRLAPHAKVFFAPVDLPPERQRERRFQVKPLSVRLGVRYTF